MEQAPLIDAAAAAGSNHLDLEEGPLDSNYRGLEEGQLDIAAPGLVTGRGAAAHSAPGAALDRTSGSELRAREGYSSQAFLHSQSSFSAATWVSRSRGHVGAPAEELEQQARSVVIDRTAYCLHLADIAGTVMMEWEEERR